jgi:hypothetical protein
LEDENFKTDNIEKSDIKNSSNQKDLVTKNSRKSRFDLDKEAVIYFSKEKQREINLQRKRVDDEVLMHVNLLELSKKDKESKLSNKNLFRNNSIQKSNSNLSINKVKTMSFKKRNTKKGKINYKFNFY